MLYAWRALIVLLGLQSELRSAAPCAAVIKLPAISAPICPPIGAARQAAPVAVVPIKALRCAAENTVENGSAPKRNVPGRYVSDLEVTFENCITSPAFIVWLPRTIESVSAISNAFVTELAGRKMSRPKLPKPRILISGPKGSFGVTVNS